MATDMTLFENAVDQVIVDSERLHNIVNGSAAEEVTTEDGSLVPTVRKAILDNLYFKTPPLPWVEGADCTVFNQLYSFESAEGTRWFYAPSASVGNPVRLPADPTGSIYWKIFLDGNYMEDYYAPKESPVFTGNPQCPTASLSSEDGTCANTSFVHQLVRSSIQNSLAGNLTLEGLNVSIQVETTGLSVSEIASFSGVVEASNASGRFHQVTLTKEDSTLGFSYHNPLDPDEITTLLDYCSVTTDSIYSRKIVSGLAVSDNDTMSMVCLGNNRFDYVYITGSASKEASEPTLTVNGITKLQDVIITGNVQGISYSIDGKDVLPRSVETRNLTVSEALVVQGDADFASISATTLEAENSLSAPLVQGVEGAFTALSISGRSTVRGDLVVESAALLNGTLGVLGATTIGASLTVRGDTSLGGATGTTTVHNLNITGAVIGSLNFSGSSVEADTVLTNHASIATSLSATSCTLTRATVTKMDFTSSVLQASSDGGTLGIIDLDGNSNMYVINVDSDITIGAWKDVTNPGTEESPRPKPFSAIIYLVQDATGGHGVSLDGSYKILNQNLISTAANSVTILRLTYAGIDGFVDVYVDNRV